MNILVLGSGGYLGYWLSQANLRGPNKQLISQSRFRNADLIFDPTDITQLVYFLDKFHITCVINLIGLANVDLCESKPELAYEANVLPVLALEQAYHMRIANPFRLVHISTDQVYDGRGPHPETVTFPVNVYGRTKLLAEEVARRIDSTILRVNFVGRCYVEQRVTLCSWIVDSLRKDSSIDVFCDVIFSPLHALTLSSIILNFVDRNVVGTFNIGSHDFISKADFAFSLSRLLDLDSSLINPVSYADANFSSPRPLDMSMDTSFYYNCFCERLPSLESQLILLVKDYL